MTKSHKRSPRHLSDTALVVLGRAADSENQMILPIPKTVRARGKGLERVMQSLLRQGFVEEVPAGLVDEVWRSDDRGRYGLQITSAGQGDRCAGAGEWARCRAGEATEVAAGAAVPPKHHSRSRRRRAASRPG